MRRWHKFFAPWFALLLFLLALSGVATQLTSVLDTPAAKPAAAAADGAPKEAKIKAKAKGDADQAPRSALRGWNRWIKHLHSGESLGPVGIALNLAGGVALLFFAGSGFWMWLSMALRLRRSRRARAR